MSKSNLAPVTGWKCDLFHSERRSGKCLVLGWNFGEDTWPQKSRLCGKQGLLVEMDSGQVSMSWPTYWPHPVVQHSLSHRVPSYPSSIRLSIRHFPFLSLSRAPSLSIILPLKFPPPKSTVLYHCSFLFHLPFPFNFLLVSNSFLPFTTIFNSHLLCTARTTPAWVFTSYSCRCRRHPHISSLL